MRADLRKAVLRLHSESGMTTLLVTHEQTEAMQMGDRVAVMRDGRVEQADTPQNLLRFPENLFVASFFGQPEVQPVRGRLEKEDGGYSVRFSNNEAIAFRSDARSLDGYIGNPVLFGIRPDSILELPTDRGDLTGVATMIEVRSDRHYVHVQIGDDTLIAGSMSGFRIRRGNRVSLRADLSGMLLFDAETGACILHGAENCVWKSDFATMPSPARGSNATPP
jgi:multiple sugar transport system ATP-binding protein